MTRKRCHRRVRHALPPRCLRPKLLRDQVTDLALAHLQNLDLISKGQASEDEMWHLVEAALLWSKVVERFARTGRIGFSGVEYQAAKLGVDVMDELARKVDQPTTSSATVWSEAQVDKLRRQRRQKEAA
jgi:hypothetical protein